jgi:glycosyltransferase involved in cell wall biosynthesis
MTAADDLTGEDRSAAPPADGGARSGGAATRRTPARRLDFDVVIATRNRPEALALSIPLILGQSRRPEKLIVIDSSDDHAPVAEAVARAVAEAGARPGAGAGAGAGWGGAVIVEHVERGVAYQRNRGVAHAEAEVVFLPDDDSLFHPGASEAIMRAYELDTERRIAAICMADAPEPPPGALSEAQYEMTFAAKREASATRRRKRFGLQFNQLRSDMYLGSLLMSRFEPLDWFEAENCVLVEHMPGYRMTFRTAVLRANPFDETLKNFALVEDLDVCFAAMRQGCLAGARNARIYHHKFPSGRGDPYYLGVVRVLNRNYVVIKHIHDAGLAPAEAARARRVVRQSAWLMVLRRLPRLHRAEDRAEVRGMLAAIRGVDILLKTPREDLSRVYSETFARILRDR